MVILHKSKLYPNHFARGVFFQPQPLVWESSRPVQRVVGVAKVRADWRVLRSPRPSPALRPALPLPASAMDSGQDSMDCLQLCGRVCLALPHTLLQEEKAGRYFFFFFFFCVVVVVVFILWLFQTEECLQKHNVIVIHK